MRPSERLIEAYDRIMEILTDDLTDHLKYFHESKNDYKVRFTEMDDTTEVEVLSAKEDTEEGWIVETTNGEYALEDFTFKLGLRLLISLEDYKADTLMKAKRFMNEADQKIYQPNYLRDFSK